MVHTPLVIEMARRVTPTISAERTMVPLWVIRQETKPEPNSEMKYPNPMSKKSDAASAWDRPRSSSIPGIKGANTIRDIKFRKKMVAKKRINPIRERNAGTGPPLPGAFCPDIVGFGSALDLTSIRKAIE
jgi:hypothetical protein